MMVPRRGRRGSDTTVTPVIGIEGKNLWDQQRIIGDHGGNDKASYATLETSLALSFFLLLPHGYSRVIWFRLQLIVLNGKQQLQ
jgi:hypothetical protein